MILPLEEKHFAEISVIHRNALEGDFQVLLGKSFLKKMYKRYKTSEYGTGYIFMDTDRVAGFVLGAYDIVRFQQEVISKDGMSLFFIALSRILLHPLMIPSLLRQFFLNLNLKKVESRAELVTIAVDSSYRNRGIGVLLFQALVEDFRKKGIISFKLTTDGENEANSRFYKKLGFTVAYSFNRFGIKQNIYTYFLMIPV